MQFAPPLIETYGQVRVVRDDLIPGGTKRRVIDQLLVGAEMFVYASPAYGYAQVALAHACRDLGKRVVIFTAHRTQPHDRTREAMAAGAIVEFVPYGYLTNVQAKARAYAKDSGACLIPFGFDTPVFGRALTTAVRAMAITPPVEVWTVAGSGTMSRALQNVWPSVPFYAVQVGRDPDVGRASLIVAPESFEQRAKIAPPFPSTDNFDAKAWRFICRQASPGSLFWNVAG